MVLDASMLNTQHYKVGINGKWSNPGKVVALSPTPRVVATEKGALWSPRLWSVNLCIYIYELKVIKILPSYYCFITVSFMYQLENRSYNHQMKLHLVFAINKVSFNDCFSIL